MATVVLVHGTTAGGWVWRGIAPRLREAGHIVYTPTLTGLGERSHLASPNINLETHILDIVNTMDCEDLENVVLVGHSYGGMVIAGVADRMTDKVEVLVYLDALVPYDGESGSDVLPVPAREWLAGLVQAQGEGWLIPVSSGRNNLRVHNTPHPYLTWTQKLKLKNPAALAAIPAVYVRCTADKGPGGAFAGIVDSSFERAQSAGWPIYEANTVHQIIPDPVPKADVLLRVLGDHVR